MPRISRILNHFYLLSENPLVELPRIPRKLKWLFPFWKLPLFLKLISFIIFSLENIFSPQSYNFFCNNTRKRTKLLNLALLSLLLILLLLLSPSSPPPNLFLPACIFFWGLYLSTFSKKRYKLATHTITLKNVLMELSLRSKK